MEIKKILWQGKNSTRNAFKAALWYTKRKAKVVSRKLFPYKVKNSYTFAILCIKKEAYTDLVVKQANSLHFFNPTHSFIIYTDTICKNFLDQKIGQFDYPEKITIKDAFGVASKPWTYYKMEMRIENSLNGGVDIDSDMFWYGDPELDRSRPLMFAPAFIFKENKVQSDLIMKVFNKPAWLEFTHYVSAFVSIPPKFMTDKLAADSRRYVHMMLEHPLEFITDKNDKDEIRRVSEEIAICFALQDNYPGLTKSLKLDGGKKNKDLLQPIYYGSENRIIT